MTPIETCVANGDEAGAEAWQADLRGIPAPETPDIHLIFNPEGLSNNELERLAECGTHEALEALDKLRQALDAHRMKLEAMQHQHKTGRNAVVGAQKKRIKLLQDLIAACEQRMNTG